MSDRIGWRHPIFVHLSNIAQRQHGRKETVIAWELQDGRRYGITSQCESGRNEPEVRLCEVRVCRKSLALSSPRTPFLDRATVLVGGDSDSVALIGGAIAGALRPDIVNEAWFDMVQTANGDDLVDIAEALAKLRF